MMLRATDGHLLVFTDGECPQLRRSKVPDAEEDVSIGKFHGLALVHACFCDAPQSPRNTRIVAVNNVGVAGHGDVSLSILLNVVARKDESPAGKLNAVSRARGIPLPVRLLDRRGDFDGRAPRFAVVGAACNEDCLIVAAKGQPHSSTCLDKLGHFDSPPKTFAADARTPVERPIKWAITSVLGKPIARTSPWHWSARVGGIAIPSSQGAFVFPSKWGEFLSVDDTLLLRALPIRRI